MNLEDTAKAESLRVKINENRTRLARLYREYREAHPETALEDAAENLTHYGWREVQWDDDRTVVTMVKGEHFIDITRTSDEKADAIAEHAHGAWEEREFNKND